MSKVSNILTKFFGLEPEDDLTKQYKHEFQIEHHCSCQITSLRYDFLDSACNQTAQVIIDPSCEFHAELIPH